MGKLTIVGLGPGNADLLTLGAVKAMQETSCLLLRTGRHPTVAELERLGLSFLTYDEVYETESSFEAVYQTITVDVLRRAETADVVYAVPGSPVVAERTVQMLCEQAQVKVVDASPEKLHMSRLRKLRQLATRELRKTLQGEYSED